MQVKAIKSALTGVLGCKVQVLLFRENSFLSNPAFYFLNFIYVKESPNLLVPIFPFQKNNSVCNNIIMNIGIKLVGSSSMKINGNQIYLRRDQYPEIFKSRNRFAVISISTIAKNINTYIGIFSNNLIIPVDVTSSSQNIK